MSVKFVPGQKVVCIRSLGAWEIQLTDRGIYTVAGYEEIQPDCQMLKLEDVKGEKVPGTYHESRFEPAAEYYLRSVRGSA